VADHSNPRPGWPEDPPTAGDAAPRERRAKHRVQDDQQSGQGSLSALSKLKMLERRRAAMRPLHDED
jgi:hypothetical protein